MPFFSDISTLDMKKVEVVSYYQMGTWLGYLREIRPGDTWKEMLPRVTQARDWLRLLITDRLHLKLCQNEAQDLLNAIDLSLKTITEQKSEYRTTGAEVDMIGMALTRFDVVFHKESAVLPAFVAEKTGIFEPLTMISNAENALSTDEISKCPQETINDLRRSGRCMMFELPTASGFHSCRALESVMLDYIERLKKEDATRGKPEHENWGAYIKYLRKHGANPKAMDILNTMRELYRNPLVHPRDNLEAGEDSKLFCLIISAIAALIKDMQSRQLYPP